MLCGGATRFLRWILGARLRACSRHWPRLLPGRRVQRPPALAARGAAGKGWSSFLPAAPRLRHSGRAERGRTPSSFGRRRPAALRPHYFSATRPARPQPARSPSPSWARARFGRAGRCASQTAAALNSVRSPRALPLRARRLRLGLRPQCGRLLMGAAAPRGGRSLPSGAAAFTDDPSAEPLPFYKRARLRRPLLIKNV